MADLERLQAAVEAGDRETAVDITQAALDEGIAPRDVLGVMTDAMGVVGDRFSRQEVFVPEMLISARAMKGGMALLEPLLIGSGHKPDKVAILGTVKGDLHDIGKNLVGMMLKGADFQIVDLGTNTTAEEFLAAAREHKADVIAAARTADDMPNLRVIVGGAPVSIEFATELDADGWAPDAATAVNVAKAVVETARGNTELAGLIHPGALATAS